MSQKLQIILVLLAIANAWPNWGGNLENNHFQSLEFILSPSTVSRLVPKWTIHTRADVAGIPTVSLGVVYFTDYSGGLWAVRTLDSFVLWKKNITSYTGNPNSFSRTAPAISGNYLVFGDKATGSGYLIAVDRLTGNLIWKTRLQTHPATEITASPTIYNGRVYIGVASGEEGFQFLGGIPYGGTYQCCTFQGTFHSIDLATGHIIWTTKLLPDNHDETGGYAGAAVWSSSAAIDPLRNAVYISTGNTYIVPNSSVLCLEAFPGNLSCLASNDYANSIVALRLDTGSVIWSHHLNSIDSYNCEILPTGGDCNFFGCLFASPTCPIIPRDWDFGQSPMLWRANDRDYVGAGQKSGFFLALNPDTGASIWGTSAGPGNFAGGLMWGSATDGCRVFVAEADNGGQLPSIPYTLYPSNVTISGGSWSAINATSGALLWQTAVPSALTGGAYPWATGPVTLANGVLYAGAADGNFYALNAVTGAILWSYNSTGSVNSAPTIVDGEVYWGTGYSSVFAGQGTFYAFHVPGW